MRIYPVLFLLFYPQNVVEYEAAAIHAARAFSELVRQNEANDETAANMARTVARTPLDPPPAAVAVGCPRLHIGVLFIAEPPRLVIFQQNNSASLQQFWRTLASAWNASTVVWSNAWFSCEEGFGWWGGAAAAYGSWTVRAAAALFRRIDSVPCEDTMNPWLGGPPRCHPHSTECSAMATSPTQEQRLEYRCKCRPGYWQAGGDGWIEGTDLVLADTTLACAPCEPGGDAAACLADVYRAALLAANLAGMLLCVVIGLIIFKKRKSKAVAMGMWTVLEVVLVGALLMYGSAASQYLSSSRWRCIAGAWLRELGFVACYGSVVLRLWVLLAEFRTRKAHRWTPRDSEVLRVVGAMVSGAACYLAAFTATAACEDGANGCARAAWHHVTAGAEMLLLFAGLRIAWAARNANVPFQVSYIVTAACEDGANGCARAAWHHVTAGAEMLLLFAGLRIAWAARNANVPFQDSVGGQKRQRAVSTCEDGANGCARAAWHHVTAGAEMLLLFAGLRIAWAARNANVPFQVSYIATAAYEDGANGCARAAWHHVTAGAEMLLLFAGLRIAWAARNANVPFQLDDANGYARAAWHHVTAGAEMLLLFAGLRIAWAARNANVPFQERGWLASALSCEVLCGIAWRLAAVAGAAPERSPLAATARAHLSSGAALACVLAPRLWHGYRARSLAQELSSGAALACVLAPRLWHGYRARSLAQEVSRVNHTERSPLAATARAHLSSGAALACVLAPRLWHGYRARSLAQEVSRRGPAEGFGGIEGEEEPTSEEVRAELKRLYVQLEILRNKTLRRDNPHISKRRGGRKPPHRRFSLQKKGSRDKALQARRGGKGKSGGSASAVEASEAGDASRTPEDSVCSNEGPSHYTDGDTQA
ncbi:7 transmembrane sweet-taste receptor of 3 GCPR domain-containing protein [Phthorimaea operculella]|nr:7 transmembrane sweet-taste receptor of 3 GCPR domain-containing protein [Phthorimaea operculella]